jgi:Haem-NO-binding
MKGVVFTEFIEMVESHFSPEIADRIIIAARLPSGGAYTTVGTYDHGEMWSLAVELSKASNIPVPLLMRSYGKYLFGRLAVSHPRFFQGAQSAFDFLQSLDGVIHVEVLKLYPDAEMPHFEVLDRTDDRLVLLYESARHFGDLAEGLMHGCASHFGETIHIAREALPADIGSRERFVLTRS